MRGEWTFKSSMNDGGFTEVGTESPATYASNDLPGRLPGQCASMHPKPTTLGVNIPYRVPRMLGLSRLFRGKAIPAHVAGLSVSTSVRYFRLKGESGLIDVCRLKGDCQSLRAFPSLSQSPLRTKV